MLKTILLAIAVIAMICLGLAAGCGSRTRTATISPAATTPPTLTTSTSSTIQSSSSTLQPASTTSRLTTPPAASSAPAGVVVNLPSFADLLDATEHSVVEIDVTATATSIFGRPINVQGAGSGWIVDSSGLIVTNNHVVEGSTTITVTALNGQTYPADVVQTDAVADLAVLKINGNGLPQMKIGDASRLRVGDWVIAIGNPLGEGIIATQGIVSRLGVTVPVSATQNYENLIETSAAINPGNSGGPLINLSGEVIGITSAKVSASGIEGMGYAINMVDALPIIQRLSSR